jgi:hypothetical protein
MWGKELTLTRKSASLKCCNFFETYGAGAVNNWSRNNRSKN